MNNIGIFAGTFDPVHQGHVAFALDATEKAGLDKVYFLPERMPRSKQMAGDFAHREALLRLATSEHSSLDILTLDSDYFTVDKTLPALKALFPDSKLSLLIGSDIACGSLAYWDNLDTLLAAAELIIGIRHEHTGQQLIEIMERLKLAHPSLAYTIIASPHADVSSSKIRAVQARKNG